MLIIKPVMIISSSPAVTEKQAENKSNEKRDKKKPEKERHEENRSACKYAEENRS